MGNTRTERNKRRRDRKRVEQQRTPKLSFREALALVPDDLPDGAYFAMAHEMADLEYGDGFSELDEESPDHE